MKQARIPGTRGGWPAELADYYRQQTGSHIKPARIASALSSILKDWRKIPPPNSWDYGPEDLLKLAFGRWVRSERRRYGVEHFAANIEDFLKGPGI